MHIAIAGAGIGGLAASLHLNRLGHHVTLFDQFETPKPVGSGLVIQPTGLAVLDQLGLADDVIRHAMPIERLCGRAAPSGRLVLDVGYGKGRVGLGIQRAALFDILYSAALGENVTFEGGKAIEGAETRADGKLRLTLEGGRKTPPFDLVVNCLGSTSPLCRDAGRLLPFGALWANLNWPEGGPFPKNNLSQTYKAAKKMVGVLPSGTSPSDAPDDTREKAAFFWSLKRDDFDAWRSAPLDQWKDEARALWPETETLLDQIESHDDLTMARYRHRTLKHPVEGRLVHLGDSYHAASPQLGQGANMALLDAAALNLALQTRTGLDAALAEYARLRRVHVSLYQAISWVFTPLYQSDSRLIPALRDNIIVHLVKIPPAPPILQHLVAGTIARPLKTLRLTEKAVQKEQAAP